MSTSRPFAYNSGSQVSGTDQLGQIAIGLTSSFNSGLGGLEWYNGPDEDLGYIICKTSSQRTWGNNAGNTSNTTIGFWRSPSKTENSFTSMVNSIFSQTFSTGDLAKTYLNNSGYWTSFSSFDPDAQLFITAANLTNSTQQNAINDLTLDMKAAGIWTKMTAIYPFIGSTTASQQWNLKDPRDLDVAFRMTFHGTGTYDSNGFQTNGTNAFSRTYVGTSSLTENDTHMSLYSRSNTGGAIIDMGMFGSGANTFNLLLRYNSGGFEGLFSDHYNFNTNRINVTTNTDTRGFFLTNRTNSTTHKVFKNGGQIGTTNTSASSGFNVLSGHITIGARNDLTAGNYSNRQYSFSTIGKGLTDLEAQVFHQIVEKYQNALGRNVVATQSFYFNRNYSNETNAFIFNAGLTSSTQQSLVNTLVSDLTTAGVWSKMVAIYPMVGGTTQSHKFNLKNPIDSNTAYRLTFSSGWTHSSTGAHPNGAAYAETYIVPTSLTLNDTHLSYYSRTNIFESLNIEMGSFNGSGNNLFALVFGRTPSNASSFQYNQGTPTTDYINVTNQSDSRGFWMGNRTSNVGNTHKLWRNGNIIGTASTTGGSFLANTIWIGAINNSAGGPPPAYYTKKECAFSSVGSGLTDAEAQSYYTAVQNFQTGLGRNV